MWEVFCGWGGGVGVGGVCVCSRSLVLNLYLICSVVFCKVLRGRKSQLIAVNEPLRGSCNQLLTCLNDLLKQKMPMNYYIPGKKVPLSFNFTLPPYFILWDRAKKEIMSFLTNLLSSNKSLLFTLFRLNYPGSFPSPFVPTEILPYL